MEYQGIPRNWEMSIARKINSVKPMTLMNAISNIKTINDQKLSHRVKLEIMNLLTSSHIFMTNCIVYLSVTLNATSCLENLYPLVNFKVVLEGYRRCPDSHDLSE